MVKSKYFSSIILLLFISFLIASCKWYGYAIMNDNKKIEGKIRMSDNNLGILIIVDTAKRKYIIKSDDIKYMKLKKKRSRDPSLYMPYRDTLWEVIYTKGNGVVYEREWKGLVDGGYYPPNNPNSSVIENYSRTCIFLNKRLQWEFDWGKEPPDSAARRLYIYRFINDIVNKKYNEHLFWKDFKNVYEIYDYIFKKELEIENKSNKTSN